MKKSNPFVASLLGAFLFAAPAHAAVIAQYPFNDSTLSSTDTEPNSTAGNFLGTSRTDWGYSSSGGNVFVLSRATTDSQANAIDADDYWSFTVTPDTGYLMNLTTITFDTIHNATAGGTEDANATMSVFLRTSVDNYASDVGDIFTNAWNTTTPRSVDLSGLDFQSITAATTFRLYVFDSGTDNPRNGSRLDNVVLNGDVVVIPESSSVLLVGLAFAGLGLSGLLRRRR